MASHRRPKAPSRTRAVVLTAAAATAVAISAQSAAQAAPKLTLDQARSEVAADRQAATTQGEQYNQAQGEQQAIQQKVSQLQNEIARQQAAVNAQLAQLGAQAAAQYRDGAFDPSMQLMLSSDPTDYLDQASTQGELDATQANLLGSVKAQQTVLAREKAEATAELKQQQALLAQMQKAKSSALAKLAAAQSVLDSLTAAERAQVAASAGVGGGGTKAGGGTTAGGGTSSGGNGGSGSVGGISLDGISSAAATAMRAAMSKVGNAPYAWQGSGPNEFDCSGLVMWAYAQAGITLPHYSYSDETEGSPVASLADAKVGDIIVLESGAHVGLYAGNGMLLNAPEYGYDVSVQPISWFGQIVAIRRF